MVIYRYETKMLLKSTLIWSLSMIGLIWMFMVIYPSFGADTALVEKMMANYPEEMLKAFGMSTELPLSSIPGYFVFAYAFVQLLLAIQASNYGFGILSVEERELTADFLMTKPVSRTQIFLGKLLAALTALTLVNLATWASSYLFIEMYRGDHTYDVTNMAILLSTNMFFQLFFLVIGMLVSVMVKKVRSVISFSMALAFGLYLLNALRGILGGELLGFFTPFYHFDPIYILKEGSYNLVFAMGDILIMIIALIATYILYNKRNIHSL